MARFVGRDILPAEKVHHVDGDKTNNSVANLYLFPNKSEHSRCHASLERCVLILVSSVVWFDRETKRYVGHPAHSPAKLACDTSDLSFRTFPESRRAGGTSYASFSSKKVARRLGHNHLHSVVAERMIGRRLEVGEVVHHVDGNGLNNSPSNIVVMTRKEHKHCHDSLSNLGFELFRRGIIIFNKGVYEIADR